MGEGGGATPEGGDSRRPSPLPRKESQRWGCHWQKGAATLVVGSPGWVLNLPQDEAAEFGGGASGMGGGALDVFLLRAGVNAAGGHSHSGALLHLSG